jgi:SAM-dependent methyltransferase
LPDSSAIASKERLRVTDRIGAMHIELSTEYYIEHLRKANRSLAAQWSLLGAHHRHLNDFIRAGVGLAPAGSRLLDAGCGLSIWITPQLRDRYSVTGVDIQPDSIRACQQIYPGCDYRHADLYHMPFPDAAFDVVVMREVIEHFKRPADAVQEVVRLLKPGGYFVLTTPNYDSWLLHFVEHTYNRFFGGSCKPYLDDVHPSRFRFSTLAGFLSQFLVPVTYTTIDLGISLGCVCQKA